MLQRKSIGKLEMLLTERGTYHRDSSGTWYLLDAEGR